MPRPLRTPVANGWYHVFGRGYERRPIFSDDRDRERFLELLDGMVERYRVRVHAYVLMGNHHHLILQTPDANLSRAMQWFNTSYSTWFNARHQRVGTLWQGRYRSVRVEDGHWAYELSTYIHLNPLRIAGLGLDKNGRVLESRGFRKPTPEQARERLERLRAYPWSSYRGYAGYQAAPAWLTTESILNRASFGKSIGREAYRRDLKHRLSQGVDPGRVARLRDVIAIGSVAFAKTVREAAPGDAEWAHRRELRQRVTLDEVRAAVEAIHGEKWSAFVKRRGDWGRSLFLWGARQRCGVTLREIGEAAGGMKPTAVDEALRRLRLRAEDDSRFQSRQAELLKRLDDKNG